MRDLGKGAFGGFLGSKGTYKAARPRADRWK